ncbi:MAG TPA: hypothetical protein VG674_13090 [Amycolatopsis sp.]|nr:hypothetical protein [Amycolatopsis sp.]
MASPACPHTIVTTDIVGSSGGGRARQAYLDEVHDRVLATALAPFAPVFDRRDGDSATLAFAPDVAPARVLADFALRELVLALSTVNAVANAEHQLRLRVAVDHGQTVVERPHISGAALTRAARLRDAPELRAAMTGHPGVQIGLIVSDTVFETIVRSGERGLDAGLFRQVPVAVKDFSGSGWIHLPGEREPDAASSTVPASAAEVIINVGTLHARDSVFGVRHA